MNLRWLFGNFADPQYGLSHKEQHKLSDLAHKKFTPRLAFLRFTIIAVAPAAIGFLALSPILARLGMRGQNGPFLVGAALIGLLLWPWCAWVYHFLYVKPFRMAMRERGYDVCVGCGYRLEGLGVDVERCPECGRERMENGE